MQKLEMLHAEMRDLEAYAAVFGRDCHYRSMHDRLSKAIDFEKVMSAPEQYHLRERPSLGVSVSPGETISIPTCPTHFIVDDPQELLSELLSRNELAKADFEDQVKKGMRSKLKPELITTFPVSRDPDLYMFPEQAYNMTGWANLNFGTKHY